VKAHFGYMAIVSDQPQALAEFYARFFDMWELGRSEAGDLSITDGWVNVSLLKQRSGVEGASGRPGLSHFGIAIDDIHELEANLEEYFPNAEITQENGDLHHGQYRVYGPNGLPYSLSTTNFGVEGTPRRIPRIRHLATSFPKWMDDESDFMTKVFGFREVSTTVERRQANRSTRFIGDGHINLALLSSGLGKAGGRGDEAGEVYRDEEERALNTKRGFQHYGFVVEDIPSLLASLPPELAKWTNQRPYLRDMAEYRVFDPDLNAIDLSQHMGFEVDFDSWENAAGSGLSTEQRRTKPV
jgi:catechol 2,3-dioxygenase-like lactoylglutathione lyase family enzyme